MKNLNTYAIKMELEGNTKAESVTELKKGLNLILNELFFSNEFLKKRIKIQATKLNISTSSIRKILNEAKEQGEI